MSEEDRSFLNGLAWGATTMFVVAVLAAIAIESFARY